MQYPLFQELKRFYAEHPEKLDSLTRKEFENIVSCEKEEYEYGSNRGFINYGSNRGTVCI